MEISPSWRYSVSWLRACSGVKHMSASKRVSFQNETSVLVSELNLTVRSIKHEIFEVKPFSFVFFYILGTWKQTVLKLWCNMLLNCSPAEMRMRVRWRCTVDNQPWADWGEGRWEVRREGSLWSLRTLIHSLLTTLVFVTGILGNHHHTSVNGCRRPV